MTFNRQSLTVNNELERNPHVKEYYPNRLASNLFNGVIKDKK
ncbi:hypothetical protein MEG1DRAFT_04172 [Photorhabdus temperata subsp. temperata Meg1]|uniref:Uncharacterized protein n=1 Tax=Photorhabdus temperata subsp. temperata Meg1 TaxID=1393735 RepID=A0A081RRB6_PHOTE|nr:hypothetical protein MEG1DRAFT_04172 [Photorhabdus temperata subsp. temperata Meg1]